MIKAYHIQLFEFSLLSALIMETSIEKIPTIFTRSKFYHSFKETKSATMNIFRFFFYFLFKSFVKVELSYVFTINMFTIAENCTEK